MGTFSGKIWQTFGGSLNFSLGCSGGVVGEGHQCRQLRQDPWRRPGWQEPSLISGAFRMPPPSLLTLTLKLWVVPLSWELQACGTGLGILCVWFISVFRRETIRQKYDQIRPVIARPAPVTVEGGQERRKRREPQCLSRHPFCGEEISLLWAWCHWGPGLFLLLQGTAEGGRGEAQGQGL